MEEENELEDEDMNADGEEVIENLLRDVSVYFMMTEFEAKRERRRLKKAMKMAAEEILSGKGSENGKEK